MILHLMALHEHGSTQPQGMKAIDVVRFHPYFTSKDLVTFILFAILLGLFVFYAPNYLGHPDNSIPANPQVTPASIVPEWYFLPFYAILRAIPNKMGGVLAMFSALQILIPISFLGTQNVRSLKFKPFMHFLFWFFVMNFFFQMWQGNKPAYQPYVLLSQISTVFYFSYFFLLILQG